MIKAIYFDMDGTIADLYGVDGWLKNLRAEQTRPYREAKPLLNMRKLARTLKALQNQGYHIGIVSWLSKNSTAAYDERVTAAKQKWLAAHLGSVLFDEIKIVPYGTPKQNTADFPQGVLFDDEAPNRKNWTGVAYDADCIMQVLESLLKNP